MQTHKVRRAQKLSPAKPEIVYAPLSGDGDAVTQTACIGRKLVEVYGPAMNGMRFIIIFGCLLDLLEEAAAREAEHRPKPKRNGAGRPRQPTDLKTLLELHAPGVSYDAAKRMRRVCRAVGVRYESIVGKTIAKKFGMAQLVTADPATLTEPLRLKQMELFDYAAGKTAKCWMDELPRTEPINMVRGPKCEKCGGVMRAHRTAYCPHCKHPTGREELSSAERFANAKRAYRESVTAAFGGLVINREAKPWMLFADDELAGSVLTAQEWIDSVKGWQAMARTKKQEALYHAFGFAAYLPGEGAFAVEKASLYEPATRRAEREAPLALESKDGTLGTAQIALDLAAVLARLPSIKPLADDGEKEAVSLHLQRALEAWTGFKWQMEGTSPK